MTHICGECAGDAVRSDQAIEALSEIRSLTQPKPPTGQHPQKSCTGKQQMEQNQSRAFIPALCLVTVSRLDRQAALTQPTPRIGSGQKLQAAKHSSRRPLLLSHKHRRPQPMLSTLSASLFKVVGLKKLCVMLHLACQLKPVSKESLPPPLHGTWSTPQMQHCCRAVQAPSTAPLMYNAGTPHMKNCRPCQTSPGGVVQNSDGGCPTGLVSS